MDGQETQISAFRIRQQKKKKKDWLIIIHPFKIRFQNPFCGRQSNIHLKMSARHAVMCYKVKQWEANSHSSLWTADSDGSGCGRISSTFLTIDSPSHCWMAFPFRTFLFPILHLASGKTNTYFFLLSVVQLKVCC